ncbi:MAG: phosphoribosyltransferase family protein, partial [Pseudomonadota bacterium]
QRKENLSGSLQINKRYNVKNKIILLVDDVRTTGVTSNSCSAILKRAGAKSVKLITIGTT